MRARRLLIVDDEPAIVQTLSMILSQHGFEVTTAGDVATALQAISSARFDVLVTDLNIGQPGDGFTVVSALRRTQPDAIALIITGFPAFDKALQAIREQVDDFLVKPIHPTELVQAIERSVHSRPAHVPLATKRISDLIADHAATIQAAWLKEMRELARHTLAGRQLSDAELLNHFPDLLDELRWYVEQAGQTTSPAAMERAREHGRLRRAQQFPVTFVLREVTAVRKQVLSIIHRNLMSLNLSYLFSDLTAVSNSLDDQLEVSMEAFLSEKAHRLEKGSSD